VFKQCKSCTAVYRGCFSATQTTQCNTVSASANETPDMIFLTLIDTVVRKHPVSVCQFILSGLFSLLNIIFFIEYDCNVRLFRIFTYEIDFIFLK